MIYLECFNDEATVRALGFARSEVDHQPGKSLVAHALQRSRKNTDIGLVDEDPLGSCPPYLIEFREVERFPQLGLRLLKHPANGQHLVEIQPDLEPWLYRMAEAVRIKPQDHHLPAKHADLHKNPKQHRKHLTSFLVACQAARSPHLAKLGEWLSLV